MRRNQFVRAAADAVNDINALLMSSARTAACNVLIALLILGPAPVAGGAIATTCQIDAASAGRSLDVLLQLGLVTHDGTGRYRTNWRLTPTGRRLSLDIFSLAAAAPNTMYLPAALSLVDDAVDSVVDNPVDNPAPDPLYAETPNLLHAGEPGSTGFPIPINSELQKSPSKQGAPGGFSNPKNSDLQNVVVGIGLKENEVKTLKTITITGNPNPRNSDLITAQATLEHKRAQSRASKQSRHIRTVTAALLTKGRPSAIHDDPFPADLRAVVERLTAATGCPRIRAEEAVSKSPWDAAQMLEQIAIWVAYKGSPLAKTITANGFPYLVAARIESGTVCPADVRGSDGNDLSRYDGYLNGGESL